MFTQCPDCSTAFKVSAEVLRQAAGKVRCGGCSNAFDALSYLSEEMPQQAAVAEADSEIPQLTPDALDSNDPLPRSISAEQSAALLKTLDQLAGSDIRIEDTGVEWRVLDEADIEEQSANASALDSELAELTTTDDEIDELLEDSPTPIDEFLTRTPEVVEAAEIFDESPAETPSVDELRFDDNTPLPDDFDLGPEPSQPIPEIEQPDLEESGADVAEERPHDITLSEPEEWQDILGEFQEIAEDLKTDDIDETGETEPTEETNSESNILDVDTQFALQAVELGIDVSGVRTLDDDNDISSEIDDADSPEELALELSDDAIDEVALDAELPVDELSSDEYSDDEMPDEEMPDDELPDDEPDSDEIELVASDDDEPLLDELTTDSGAELTIADELAALEALDEAENPTIDSGDEVPTDAVVDESATDADAEHYVAPLSKEEQTVNMLIDQDLMALAIEDEDGFASTIIIPPERAEGSTSARSKSAADVALNETSDGFESIVMEGEFVKSALDKEQLAIDAAASAEISKMIDAKEMASLPPPTPQRRRLIGGIVVLAVLIILQVLHQSREALATNPTFNNAVGPIYRALGQPLQPRWDVTGWRFEATTDIGQDDVAPQSEDSAEDGAENGAEEPPRLTVYSIIGNKSDAALPYPLIAISLTDRYDATIGNSLLEPGDYLPREEDAGALVAAGNSFNALINIEPLPDAATGFKLDVCYRIGDRQLRCAIEDFK